MLNMDLQRLLVFKGSDRWTRQQYGTINIANIANLFRPASSSSPIWGVRDTSCGGPSEPGSHC